ncbi:MAG: hypothetical protein J6I84_04065 [Bacilli bacterium]|nr:hypothetical protein [Bacilli bacterium]
MIDNFDLIRPHLVFGPQTYYIVQILQRKKDLGNEGLRLGTNRKWIKYIAKPETFDLIKPEVEDLCRLYNARAYIDLNPRNLERWTITLIRKLVDRMYSEDMNNIWSVPNQVALSEETIKTRGVTDVRKWVVDVDRKEDYQVVLDWLEPEPILTVPTPNGYHIIIPSFGFKDTEKDIKISGTDVTTCIKPQGLTVLWADI